MSFPSDEAKLVSIFVQTLLYGAYTIVFILTVWVLLVRQRTSTPIQDPMLWISFVMRSSLSVKSPGVRHHTLTSSPGLPRSSGAQCTYCKPSSEIASLCYLVWGGARLIAIPSVLLLGSTASGIGILYSFAKTVPDAEIFADKLQKWIVSFFSLTLATNIICTGLVALRIWWINRAIMKFTSRSYRPILFLVLESGAVYSVTLMALLILYKTGSWFQYVLLDAISPIVGLVFSMVIIRIGLGITTVHGVSTAQSVTSWPQQTARAPDSSQPIQFVHRVRHSSDVGQASDAPDVLELRVFSTTGTESLEGLAEHDLKIAAAELPLGA
ncbi:hypothetical protein C8Q77DRAFT_893101 [Trametes polyzona]|nr:hypothetical protein C8Q77DRAFT_893101 [Trametes polyzona]